jgi:hypothetical protein
MMPLLVATLGTAGDKVKTLDKEILTACGKARDALNGNGWDDYRNLGKAHGPTFQMHFNLNFPNLKTYANPTPATCAGQSQFETLVHELSHLVLNTNDETLSSGVTAYGGSNARTLAAQSPDKAKNNAENWGFFIEDFR